MCSAVVLCRSSLDRLFVVATFDSAFVASAQRRLSLVVALCLFSFQSQKKKKDEEVTDAVADEKVEGTLARVTKVMGRTGSRGGVTQV